jgi:hypothetical protein
MHNFTFLDPVVQYLSSANQRSRRSHVDINDGGKVEEFKVWAAATSTKFVRSLIKVKESDETLLGRTDTRMNGHDDMMEVYPF